MDLNCELCANKKECFDSHWCVTMDRGRKINNEYICDNFELSGRKYEELKEKNKKLEEEKAAYVKGYMIASDEYVETTIKKIKQKDFYEKVIDRMAEDVANSDIDEDICRQYESKEKRCAEGNNQKECVKCIKRYYFKKVRGE